MTRQAFDQELERLQGDVLTLGSMAEQAILDSVAALRRRDLEASRRLIARDRVINEERFAIEADCISLIATQQPMAKDLRILAAVLEIVTELERIADYAKGIAKINLMMGAEPLVKPLVDIPRMAEKAQDMLHRALDAFVRQDAALARAIPLEDDEVDCLYNQVHRELLTYIIADPRVIQQANYLLWVAHDLERAADRVSNICERVVFTVTGEVLEMDSDDTGM
ncbi:MAG: phosphate signaling complex protein PhoU [Chloroflexi bacterium]|nr:phosphate signaling complex protein PhoU [Chloroflexota bacterium]